MDDAITIRGLRNDMMKFIEKRSGRSREGVDYTSFEFLSVIGVGYSTDGGKGISLALAIWPIPYQLYLITKRKDGKPSTIGVRYVGRTL